MPQKEETFFFFIPIPFVFLPILLLFLFDSRSRPRVDQRYFLDQGGGGAKPPRDFSRACKLFFFFFFLSWRQSRPDLSGISTCKSIIQRTDEWRDERVVLFASQRHQRIQMIDVAVGIGDQQLGSHLQFHLDPFPQDCLERKCQSARFKGRRKKNAIYPQLLFPSLLVEMPLCQLVLALSQLFQLIAVLAATVDRLLHSNDDVFILFFQFQFVQKTFVVAVVILLRKKKSKNKTSIGD